MITKMVIAIVLTCFGCMSLVNGMIHYGATDTSKMVPILYVGVGLVLACYGAFLSRKSGLVEGLQEELTTGVRIIHESASSIVAIVVGTWSLSYAFFMGPTSNIGILYLTLGFALLIIGFRHLRKTGWFLKMQEEALTEKKG